ncbi:MAG: outer membrane protein transport protein [SAR324 cluster bacterium]|nr:outer membrane protein transport protein [SAR324 cluster bacterium]
MRTQWKINGIMVLLWFMGISTAYGALGNALTSTNQLVQNAVMTFNDYAETVATNPAGMMRLEPGMHFSIGGHLINFRLQWEGSFGGDGSADQADKNIGKKQTETSLPIELLPLETGGFLTAPSFEFAKRNDDDAWGFAFKPTFAAAMKWDRNWAGKDIVQDVTLVIVGLNVNYATDLDENNHIAFGVTHHIPYFDYRRDGIDLNLDNPLVLEGVTDYVNELTLGLANLLPEGFNLDTIVGGVMGFISDNMGLFGLSNPIRLNETIHLYGNGGGQNFNVAYLGQYENFFLAMHYQSSFKLTILGEGKFSINPLAEAGLILADTAISKAFPAMSNGLNLKLNDMSFKANVGLPWYMETALGWKDDPENPTIEGEVGYAEIGFSMFSTLSADLPQRASLLKIVGFEEDNISLPFQLQDIKVYRAGGAYHFNEKYLIRGGAEKTTSLTDPRLMSAIIPIGEVVKMGIGGEYRMSNTDSISFGFATIILMPTTTNSDVRNNARAGVFQDPFNGTWQGLVGAASVTYNFKFGGVKEFCDWATDSET